MQRMMIVIVMKRMSMRANELISIETARQSDKGFISALSVLNEQARDERTHQADPIFD